MVPRVSVLMTVYNGERYLQAALDGILNQTYGDWQLVVVDDGSTDQTPRILASCRDRRVVRVENGRNLGLTASLNRAIECATGVYLARQDADDVSLPERLERQVAFLDAHPRTGVVGATSIWIDDESRELQVWQQPTANPELQERLLGYCPIVHGSAMMRREAAAEVGGYAEEMHAAEDYDLWLRVSERWDLAVLPEPLYLYRWHGEMASKQRAAETHDNARSACARALLRRRALGRSLALAPRAAPAWTHRYLRAEWADRFLWWAAGARYAPGGQPAQFAWVSLLLNPMSRRWWAFMVGVAARKLGTWAGVGDHKGRPYRTCDPSSEGDKRG